jgi:hypothetical protein
VTVTSERTFRRFGNNFVLETKDSESTKAAMLASEPGY